MRATQEQRAEFGARLHLHLEQVGLTQAQLRQLLSERGVEVSRTAVSNWVNGRFTPDRTTAAALDELVEANGGILDALGYSPPSDIPALSLPGHVWDWLQSLEGDDLIYAMELIEKAAAAGAEEAARKIVGMISTMSASDRPKAPKRQRAHLRAAAAELEIARAEQNARLMTAIFPEMEELPAAAAGGDVEKQKVGSRRSTHPGGADPEPEGP